MQKEHMIEEIVDNLATIGIFPALRTDTDIKIEKEFLDAKFSTGEKKISYTGLALFDETKKTLYYYEKTIDLGKGFSFGMTSESYSQSGTTLLRKVKSVGYAPDGRAYDYEINFGQIVNVFKDSAKKNGWKFKIVLNSKKAKYSSEGLPANYEKSLPEKKVINKPTKITKPIDDLPVTNNSNNGFIIIVVLSFLYLLMLSANVVGWLLTAGVLWFAYSKKLVFIHLSPIKKIFILILIFFVIFFIGAFTTKTSQNSSNNNDANKPLANDKSPYYVTGESYSALPGYEYIVNSDYKKIMPNVATSILISINGYDDEAINNIKKIIIKNAVVKIAPEKGTSEFYFYDIITEDSANQQSTKHVFENNSFTYSIDDFKNFRALMFYYIVKDIKTQDVSGWSVIDSNNAIIKSGVKSDEVRSTITFEIEITDASGQTYSRMFTQELFAGDFLNDSNNQMITQNYYNDDILYLQKS